MAQVPTLARMLVFMVGSSGVLVLLSGIMRGLCRCRNGGKKPGARLAVTEEGAAPSRSMRASLRLQQEQQPNNPAHAREHCVSTSVV